MIGKRFGRLIIINKEDPGRKGESRYNCRCDCGNFKIIYQSQLKRGKTKSCGCLQRESSRKVRYIHGMSNSKLFNSWRGMIGRCNNPKNINYKNYGARQITICNEWATFNNFRIWAISHGYVEGLTIERKDNNGNYCPENCTWATKERQCNNRRNNKIITFDNRSQTLSDWSKETKISRNTITKRLKSGWPIFEALTIKVGTIKTGPKPKAENFKKEIQAITGKPVFIGGE